MATNNAANQKFTNSADGFILGGGTTERDLTVTGANITLTGSGTNVYTMPAATDTLVGKASTDVLTNKTFDTAGTGNVFKINGTQVTAVVGTGANVLANTPTLITPVLGVATATSINGLTLTSSTGTVTITNLKTLAVTNTLTLSGTDSTVMTFPTTTATIARTDAGQTFTGTQTITTIAGLTTVTGAASNMTITAGTGNSRTLILQTTTSGGVATTALTLNADQTATFAAGATVGGTLALAANSITMSGSIGVTGTRVTKLWATDIESTNAPTVGGTALPTSSSTTTLTNKRITPRVLSAASYTTDTGTSINGDTQDMFIVTAQAGALKFNNPSGTPTDGQKLILTVASSTTAARALTWDTAYGATTVALPTTTAATTATLSIGFIWSASKSLWQCVASA